MKKILFLLLTFGITATGLSQDIGLRIGGGYLTELEGFGGSADFIYNINEKFAVATNATFAQAEEKSIRNKWFAIDLNGHYKVVDELYVLAGGQYLSITLKELGIGGGNPLGQAGEASGNDFGINVGSGYKYNLADNVNIFAEAKYVIIETGYFHARIGLQFDL